MDIKPVRNTKNPNYPTLEYYIENPEMLSRSIPDSWIKNKYVATSLATFILCGCGNSNSTKASGNSSIIEVVDREKNDSESVSYQPSKVKIAPIFSHGDGRGAIGCIVMSPPVFISEDEARKIIFDAFKEHNILLDTLNCPVLDFKAPPIANDCFDDDEKKKVKDAKVKIKIDGYNAKLNLAVEFVSIEDFDKFRSDDGCYSSVQGFDTKQAAELIRKELELHGKTNSVVFYDPIRSIDFEGNKDWRRSKITSKKEAVKLLLAQVSDFIDWLKKEKMIEQ